MYLNIQPIHLINTPPNNFDSMSYIIFISYFQGKSRTGFFKQAKKAYPMFPFSEERLKWDEYGEIIR